MIHFPFPSSRIDLGERSGGGGSGGGEHVSEHDDG